MQNTIYKLMIELHEHFKTSHVYIITCMLNFDMRMVRIEILYKTKSVY